MKTTLPLCCALVCVSSAASAHDYWLQPERFVVPVDAEFAVRLFVGDEFQSELERPYQPQPTLGFRLISRRQTRDLKPEGVAGKKPLIRMRIRRAGTHLLAMERDVQYITLKPEKFNRYLKHEKLGAALKARRDAGELNRPGRERYSRFLKCLIDAGPERDDTWKRVLKQRLEIVPLTDPAGWKKNGRMKVRVLFAGKPLPATAVFRHYKAGSKVQTISATTDKNGTATFKVPGSGTYLVRLVYMRRCDDKRADWESFWGALSFAVP